jgi:hypothetical protein
MVLSGLEELLKERAVRDAHFTPDCKFRLV